MNAIKSKVVCFVVAYIFLLPLALAHTAEIEGFRELKWGMTIDQAKNIYKDLIEDKKFAPEGSAMFFREREDKNVNNVKVDYINYYYKNDKLYMVKVGSRQGYEIAKKESKHSNKSGEIFDAYLKLKSSLEGRLGQPSSATDKDRFGNRSVKWFVGDVVVELVHERLTIMGNVNESTIMILKNEKAAGINLGF